MAAFTRVSLSSNLYFPTKTLRFHFPFRRTQQLRCPQISSSFSRVSCLKLPFNFPKIPFLNSSRDSSPAAPADFSVPEDYLVRLFEGREDATFSWNFASGESANGNNKIFVEDNGPEVAAVVLGWLWAEPHHLTTYSEMYNAKGVHAVTFVPSVVDLLPSDWGNKEGEKIKKLADELTAWLLNDEDRLLIFHTFSFTGWLAYGAILDYWKDRQDLLEKIKGCVVDSGGGYSSIDPKVWAAGLTTAMLEESGHATYPLIVTEGEVENDSFTEENEAFQAEMICRLGLEELFSYFLNFSDVRKLLAEMVSGISKNQPSCPQLYLYSTEDKIVPYQAVESFIEEQRGMGRQVCSFNFESSAHVDHFRSFRSVYSSEVHKFLKGCLITEGKLLKQG